MNVYIKKQNFIWQKITSRFLVVVFLLVFLNMFHLQVRDSFFYISSPISQRFLIAGSVTYNFFNAFIYIGDFKRENSNLKKENQNLLANSAFLQAIIKQNKALTEAVANTKDSNFTIAIANIMGLDLSNDLIFIDKGLEDGILENMPVISKEKVVYGKVVKSYATFSRVKLISAKENVLDVKVHNSDALKNPVHGVVKGIGNLSIYLDLVNSESEIKEGDVLLTSALEGTFPPNLLIGNIKSVIKNDANPFQQADVQQFFDIKNIDTLFVITNYRR